MQPLAIVQRPSHQSQDDCLAAGTQRPTSTQDHAGRRLALLFQDRHRRDELAAFLRARRESLQPEDLGLPRRGRRRVKGLRRHEVADIAAVSVTWYTWLEQGRNIQTTPQVVEALAQALQLDHHGHSYLRRLAGITASSVEREDPEVTDSEVNLVDGLLPNPAHMMRPAGDLVVWNAAYARLFVDPLTLPEENRNGLWIQVMCPEMRGRFLDWESETRSAIARFRAAAAKYPGNSRFADLAASLSRESDFFRTVWQSYQVEGAVEHVEVIDHPLIGRVSARPIQLRPLDHPDLLIMAHMLQDQTSRDKVASLLDLD